MNTKSNKQIIEDENMSSLKILRYKDNSLNEIEDQVGVESAITVKLGNGNKITLPCTAVHLEELALGIAFSLNPDSRTLDDHINPYDPISYEKVLIAFKGFLMPVFIAECLSIEFDPHCLMFINLNTPKDFEALHSKQMLL